MGIGVLVRIVVVNAVHTVLGNEEFVAMNLEGALRGNGIRREVRQARTSTEDNHTPLFQVTNRSQRKVRLSHLRHRDGRLHASRNT